LSNLLFGVDRFIVMEGVVICDGWCSGMAAPDASAQLLFDGAPLPVQQLVAVDRPDLIALMRRDVPEQPLADREAPRRWGFCIRALLPLPPAGGDASITPWGGEEDECYRRLSLRLRGGGAEELLEDPAKTHLIAINAEHRELSRRFRQAIIESTAPRILEIGAHGSSLAHVMGKRHAPPAGATYLGMDFHRGEGVNVVGDAHRLSELLSEPVDFVFSVSTFEHLLMPWKVAVEIARVLRVGGMAYIHTHPSFPLHSIPHDFFRLSKWAWPALFNRHTGFEVLGATHAEPCVMTPMLQRETRGNLRGMFRDMNYVTTGCLARKISEPKVDWPLAQEDVLSTAYPQASLQEPG